MLLVPTLMLWMTSPWSLITLSSAWMTAMNPGGRCDSRGDSKQRERKCKQTACPITPGV